MSPSARHRLGIKSRGRNGAEHSSDGGGLACKMRHIIFVMHPDIRASGGGTKYSGSASVICNLLTEVGIG